MPTSLSSPFLTDLDSRAAIKGSRDPLGIQAIWTRFGRQVIGNLTTVSNSVVDFTTTLLGYWFAERISDDDGPGTELATFLKWEQLAGYARAEVNGDTGFRGTERVRRNLADGSRITLSDSPKHQILSNQKVYGLWGLYTVPSRSSGLLEGEPPRLTREARAIVEGCWLPALESAGGTKLRRFCDVLRAGAVTLKPRGRDATLLAAVAKVLRPRRSGKERAFYVDHLLFGGPLDGTGGRQRQLAELLRRTEEDGGVSFTPALVSELGKQARRRGEEWEPLAHQLDRIRACESVLAPVSLLFTYLLGLDGLRPANLAARLKAAWGPRVRTVRLGDFEVLEGDLADGDPAGGKRWVAIAEALSTGDYAHALRGMLDQNASVMQSRGGTPWIELRSGALHVRFRDEQGALPARRDLQALWRYPYFMPSLQSVARQLEPQGNG